MLFRSDNKLNYGAGSSSVIKEIKKMIAANKNVVITGRLLLQNNIPEVADFLSNTMGIRYNKRMKASSIDGNTKTIWSFFVHGADDHVLGQSFRKGCNIIYMPASGGDQIASEDDFDTFFSVDPVKYPPVEHLIWRDDFPRTDTIVGIRTEIDSARIVLYSLGFEAFSGPHPRAAVLYFAIHWAAGNIIPDEATIDYNPPNLDFGRLNLDSTAILNLDITNTGKVPMDISETSFFSTPDDDADGAFKIYSGEIKSTDKPVTLKTGQKHILQMSFTPKTVQTYSGKITIFNSSSNTSFLQVALNGIGGQDNAGAKIETNFGTLMNFGQVKKGKNKVDTLKIYNTGDKELDITAFKIDKTVDTLDIFSFANTLTLPIMIAAKDSVAKAIKFAPILPSMEFGIYRGKINVECNATNKSQFSIDLQGELISGIGVPEGQQISSDDGLFTMKINPNPAVNYFNINYSVKSEMTRNIRIKLLDLNGKSINTIFDGSLQAGDYNKIVNTDFLSDGVYFLNAEIDGHKYVLNVVVKK